MNRRIFTPFSLMLFITLVTLLIPIRQILLPVQAQDADVELIGQFGGSIYSVDVQGSYAYIDMDFRLAILDISNPAQPVLIGETYTLPNSVADIAVAGNYAYVTTGSSGLRIINVANPAAPIEVGFYDTPGYAQDVAVVGNYAYVADGSGGLRIINVANPAAPIEVGFLDPGDITRVDVVNNYAYVTSLDYYDKSSLRIVNVTNPAAPTEEGYLEVPGDARDVAVAGNYAYIADYFYGGGLRIIDIANPAAPAEVGSFETPGQALGISVAGNYAYVADSYDGLRIINIANPAAPIEVGFYDTLDYARDVAVSGNYIYVVDRSEGLVILRFTGGETTYSISGRVTDITSNPLSDVTISDDADHSTSTNSNGDYTLSGLPAGGYTITPSKSGYTFSPPSLSVSVPPDATDVNFTGMACVSSNTVLDVCELQRGDILLAKGQLDGLLQTARIIAGTYWFHAAIYLGDGRLAHATGPGFLGVPLADQVKTDSIYDKYWWTGTGLNDWAVIRPSVTDLIKDQTATYAKSKADQSNPDILYNLDFSNKDREDAFYCSQLPWKAYQRQGLNLEVNKGILPYLLPATGPIVTPDDLYYSVSANIATLVQEKQSLGGTIKRWIFRIFSPANMLLIDPLGRQVGFDPSTQQVINEIPGADYIGPNDEPETLSLAVADIPETWTLKVTGTGNGTYKLAVEVVDLYDPISQTLTLPTSLGKVDTFQITDPIENGGQLIKQKSYIFLPLIVK